MYRIQSSSKRHLINLAYLGVKLKKTLAIKLHKFMCHNIQTEDKKVFHSSKVNIQFFCYIDVLTVCYYHVTYAFQSESTLYSCLNVKELLARSRREI